MTDKTTQPQQTDPLATLEDALKNTQQPATDTPAAPPTDPAVVEAKQRQDLAAMEAQHDEQDAAQIKTQLDNLHQMAAEKATETAQAKPAAEPQPTSPAANDQAGYEIHQVGHTKIQKDA